MAEAVRCAGSDLEAAQSAIFTKRPWIYPSKKKSKRILLKNKTGFWQGHRRSRYAFEAMRVENATLDEEKNHLLETKMNGPEQSRDEHLTLIHKHNKSCFSTKPSAY